MADDWVIEDCVVASVEVEAVDSDETIEPEERADVSLKELTVS